MAATRNDELSTREIEILRLVATGATNQQVARALYISPNTVKTHLRNIFGKLNVESRTEATLYAVQCGLVDVGPVSAVGARDDGADAVSPMAPVALPVDPLVSMYRQYLSMPRSPWPRILPAIGGVILALVLMLWPVAVPRGEASGPDALLMDAILPDTAGEAASSAARWSERSPMARAAGRFALAAVAGRIYAIGGAGQGGVLADVQAYDPGDDRWEARARKPTAAANVGAAVIDGLIYVPGGLDAEGQALDVLEVYDPSADAWHEGPALPQGLCGYAIAVAGDALYLFGGWDGTHYVDSVYRYAPSEGAWDRVGTLGTSRGFAAAATAGESIYLVGGYDGASAVRTCEVFDPAGGRSEGPWTSCASMQTGRAGHTLVSALGHLYVLGGGWQASVEYGERYDVANDAWGTVESPVGGEWRMMGATTVDGASGLQIYAFGGWLGAYLADVHVYQAFYRLYLP
jgi:DNA-binding CsgD family transcriptional regulator/N-acetylneuraminic acid mutarotase